MIGRQREVEALWRQLEQARQGVPRVALLAGEPGIGKTRLLRELARRAAAAGVTVLRGGATDAEGMPPYLPFLETFICVTISRSYSVSEEGVSAPWPPSEMTDCSQMFEQGLLTMAEGVGL